MPFKYVGHLEYQNAEIWYTAANGKQYEIPGSYSGAYPGSTRESSDGRNGLGGHLDPGGGRGPAVDVSGSGQLSSGLRGYVRCAGPTTIRATFEVRLAERDPV